MIVLAIPYSIPVRFGTTEDQRRMEQECEMRIGRKSYQLVGHFPPAQDDPTLRLVFPRAVKAEDKSVSFRLTVGSAERTLSSDEVGQIRAAMIEGMQQLGYELRV